MARSGNRVMKQKTEKGKKLARDVRKGRELGMREPEKYRKEAVNTTTRPKKAEREADAAATAKHFSEAAAKGPKSPNVSPIGDVLKSPAGEMEASATGVGLVSKRGKAVAQAQAAAQNIGLGLSTVSKEGKEKPVTGRERASVLNELKGSRTEYIKGRKKREEAADAATVAKAIDTRPAKWKRPEPKKKAKTGKVLNEPKVGVSASEALPAQGGPKNIVPGSGNVGILNTGKVADTAGELSGGRRRRLERKALYNMKKSGKSKGYTEASKLGTRTAEKVNARRAQITEETDRLAREKAARSDAKKDALKASLMKKAGKLTGPEADKVRNTAESIIREPEKVVLPQSVGRTRSVVDLGDGKKSRLRSSVVRQEVRARDGKHAEVTVPDEKDITKKYTKLAPVGAPRLTEQTSKIKEPIKMDRSGTISLQPNRPKETATGMLGSHEDRMHALTKWMGVPAGTDAEGKKVTADLEPKYLRSYLKHKAESAGLKYNERDMVAAVFHARHKDPEKFTTMIGEAHKHRQSRIGTENIQKETAAAKAAEKRSSERESRGGRRQSPRASRIVSNVSSGGKFTEISNGEKKA